MNNDRVAYQISDLTAAAARFMRMDNDPDSFGSSGVLGIREGVDRNDIDRVLRMVVESHEMLRSRYSFGTKAEFWIDPPSGDVLNRVEVASLDAGDIPFADLVKLIDTTAVENLEKLDPQSGNVLRATIVNRSNAPDVLIVTVHHLVSDGVSGRILFDDLSTGIDCAAVGKSFSVVPEKTSCVDWVKALRSVAKSRERRLGYWLDLANSVDSVPNTGVSDGPVNYCLALDRVVSERIVNRLPFTYGAPPADILLTAFCMAVNRMVGATSTVLVQGHGRHSNLLPHLDISRTIGWFADDYPVRLDPYIDELPDPIASGLELLPSNPEDYTLLSAYSQSSVKFEGVCFPKFYFNFIGDTLSNVVTAVADSEERLVRQWDVDRLSVFSLSLQIKVVRAIEGPQIEFSMYSPGGSYAYRHVKELAHSWISILERIGT